MASLLMEYHKEDLLLLLLLHSVCVCHGTGLAMDHGKATATRLTTAAATTETAAAAHTASEATIVSPPSKVHYHVNVTSTGLAALDSTVFFEAKLILQHCEPETSVPVSERFVYQWTNTANRQQMKTYDGFYSKISVVFPSQGVTAGEYLMTVAVYKRDDQTTIITFTTLKFKLTQELNGLLTIMQRLDYQRHAHIFSTQRLLILTAAVHDLFLQSNLTFYYYWFKGEGIMAQTKQPNCATVVHTPANTSLASFICVHGTNRNRLVAARHHESQVTVDLLPENFFFTLNGTVQEHLMLGGDRLSPCVTSGMFELDVSFKDPILACHVSRIDVDPKDRGIDIKKSALVNITCVGSTPSSVCINITSPNSSLAVSDMCQPQLFVNELSHLVHIQLTSTGWHDVHFLVYNDVSRHQLVKSFYGYDADSMNVPALTIPLVFAVIGFLIVVVAGAYIIHHRKKSRVEVADFDFHPALTSSQVNQRFQLPRMSATIRSMFFRDQYQIEHKYPSLCRPAFDVGNREQFYDSL